MGSIGGEHKQRRLDKRKRALKGTGEGNYKNRLYLLHFTFFALRLTKVVKSHIEGAA